MRRDGNKEEDRKEGAPGKWTTKRWTLVKRKEERRGNKKKVRRR